MGTAVVWLSLCFIIWQIDSWMWYVWFPGKYQGEGEKITDGSETVVAGALGDKTISSTDIT